MRESHPPQGLCSKVAKDAKDRELYTALVQALIALFLLPLFLMSCVSDWLALVALWLLMTVVASLLTKTTPTIIPFTRLVVFPRDLQAQALLLAVRELCAILSHLGVFFSVTAELTA